MASDIIDNRRERLADRVRDLLEEGAVCARFAVGYLFLEGLAPLRAQIEQLQEVQFLIGNVVNRLTEEQVREEAVSRLRGEEFQARAPVRDQEDMAVALREAHSRAAAVTALNLRRTIQEMPRDRDCQALLLSLAGRIADGTLKVRVYTQARLHAKLALVEYPNDRRIAIVGSSNLTLGGVAQPTEMNVVVKDRDSVGELADWYGSLWENSQDFHRELFEELGQCWAMTVLPAVDAEGRE
jgi:phosphatidylserine/phosphatidylglycerophosphate/cardiolipin synthase-like enzyme